VTFAFGGLPHWHYAASFGIGLSTNRKNRVLRVEDLNLRRFGPYDRSPRAQLSIRRDRRNYDPSIAGLGTGKAQRYLASDLIGFRLCDATEIAVVEVVAGSAQHRGTARAQPVQQCSTGSRKDDDGEIREEAEIASIS
jgi:hypothetical protein